MTGSTAFPFPSLWGRVFLPFACGYYLSYLLRTVNGVISPELSGELALSSADLGLLTSTYFLAFGLAQLPLGIALDRYGPRRVAATLLLLAALGCALFASGTGLAGLALARAVVGLGVSACLMAALKGFALWFPAERQVSMTGFVMAAGALGAVTASVPLEALLPFVGWRGVFWGLSVLALGVAALVFWRVPEEAGAGHRTDLAHALAGVATVWGDRRLWRYAGQAAFFTGGFMAIQGLWAVPWLMQANGYSRSVAADHLAALNLGMLLGQFAIGALATRLAAWGLSSARLMGGGMLLTLAVEALIVARLGPTLPLWLAFGAFAATGAQVYGVVARQFSMALSGRVTTVVNLLAFAGAFVVQWGLGLVLDALGAAGLAPAQALTGAFLMLLALQGASLLPLLARRR